jgi:hypothetical protein
MKTILLAAGIFLGCLNVTSLAQGAGTKIWDYTLGADAYVGPLALGPNGTIYFFGNNYLAGLYAVNTNGNLIAHPSTRSGLESPTVGSDGTVYVAEWATLYAYDPTLTNTKTAVFTASANIGSDILLGEDGTFYFGAADGKLYAVHPNGSLHWQYATPDGSAPDWISLSTDGTVYFSSGTKLYALTPSGTKKWAFPYGGLAYGFAAVGKDGTVYVDNGTLYALYPESTNPNGTKKWDYGLGCAFAPVIGADGTIYAAGGNFVLYALRPNGTKKWEFQAGDRLDRRSAAIGRDGTIYVGCNDHFLYAVNPDGTFKWAFETAGEVTSAVIAADGTIYVGCGSDYHTNYGKLYAIRGDAVSPDSPWPMFGRDRRRSGRVTCPKGAPCFDTERMTTNGAFDMVLIGEAGATYGFDASTNLATWSRLTNRVSANGAIRLVDETATNYPYRFYRATAP